MNIETELLNIFIAKHPEYSSHLEFIKVKNRKFTGVGMYINFEYEHNEITYKMVDFIFSNNETIYVDNLTYGLGYEIDITNGQINFIEFITYGESWNGEFENYKIIKD